MSRRGVALLIAVMAALAGAPSSVFAAAPNQLTQASVTQTPGGAFVVTAHYLSPAGNPATAMTVSAAGEQTPMTLISGTAIDGVWRATPALPPGDWEVTVAASVAKGSQPTLVAGTVSVGGEIVLPVSSPPGSSPSTDIEPAGGGGTSATPAAQPAATSAPSVAATPAPARSRTVADPSQPPSAAATGRANPVRARRSVATPARSPRPDAAERSQAAQVSPAATATNPPATTPGQGSNQLGFLMLVATLAVGMVALAGSIWMFWAARQKRLAAILAGAPTPTDPGLIATAIVEQRALRRARLRSADDPILAAMGLPDEDDNPAATRAARRSGARGRRRPKPPKR